MIVDEVVFPCCCDFTRYFNCKIAKTDLYRVFQLALTDFEDLGGQLKTTLTDGIFETGAYGVLSKS